VCAALRSWRQHGQRELPWLAGPVFSALGAASLPAPTGPDVTTLERFLLGVETDPVRVSSAIDAVSAAGADAPTLPPDARGTLVDAVEEFFTTLATVYATVSDTVREGHRRYVDDQIAEAQPRLDAAVALVHERARLLGRVEQPTPKRRVTRHHRDRNAVAIGFVLLALIGACVMVYAVLMGWPMEPLDFGF